MSAITNDATYPVRPPTRAAAIARALRGAAPHVASWYVHSQHPDVIHCWGAPDDQRRRRDLMVIRIAKRRWIALAFIEGAREYDRLTAQLMGDLTGEQYRRMVDGGEVDAYHSPAAAIRALFACDGRACHRHPIWPPGTVLGTASSAFTIERKSA